MSSSFEKFVVLHFLLDYVRQSERQDLVQVDVFLSTESYLVHLFDSSKLGWLTVARYYFGGFRLFEARSWEVVKVFPLECLPHNFKAFIFGYLARYLEKFIRVDVDFALNDRFPDNFVSCRFAYNTLTHNDYLSKAIQPATV